MEATGILLQGVVVIGAILLGVRTGGIGLGLWGLVGLAVLVFGFGLPPGEPPTTSMFIILSVITAASTMQAVGGIDYLVEVAKKLLKKKPAYIALIAPIVAFIFTLGAGTGFIYYPLIPVIYAVAYANMVRPERPLAVASTASQFAITASPVSAAMATMVGILDPIGFGITDILIVILPASIVGLVCACFLQMRVGKDLADDPEYQRRVAAGEIQPIDMAVLEERSSRRKQAQHDDLPGGIGGDHGARHVRAAATGLPRRDGCPGAAEHRRDDPDHHGCHRDGDRGHLQGQDQERRDPEHDALGAHRPDRPVRHRVAGRHLDRGERGQIVGAMGDLVEQWRWFIAIAIFIVAALTTSQAAALAAIVPIGLALGIPPQFLVAFSTACIGIYFFPANGSQVTAIATDETGTTKISKYAVWHSFSLPMFVMWLRRPSSPVWWPSRCTARRECRPSKSGR